MGSQPNEETLEEKTGVTPVSFAVSVLNIEKKLSDALNQLPLSPPVEYSYNPLNYAWDTHSCLVTKYCNSRKRILFVGMNPGPWGMVQTGGTLEDQKRSTQSAECRDSSAAAVKSVASDYGDFSETS